MSNTSSGQGSVPNKALPIGVTRTKVSPLALSLIHILPVGLILKQPDLGTAISIIVIVTGVVYFSGAPGKLILALAGIGFLALLIVFGLYWYAGMPFPIEEHWIDRIVSAFNPEKDPLGLGYQVLQSKIAIGSGGLWGKGLGQGTQNRLDFIPEQHTDFIFSVVGEELGFIGTIGVIALYALILYRCLCIASVSYTHLGGCTMGGLQDWGYFGTGRSGSVLRKSVKGQGWRIPG